MTTIQRKRPAWWPFAQSSNARTYATEEQCGVIVGPTDLRRGSSRTPLFLSNDQYTEGDHQVIPIPNSSATPWRTFEIVRSDLNTALDAWGCQEADIAGYWHSHPPPWNSGPSDADLETVALLDQNLWHAIWHVDSGRVTWYDYDNNYVEVDDDGQHDVRTELGHGVVRVRRSRKPR